MKFLVHTGSDEHTGHVAEVEVEGTLVTPEMADEAARKGMDALMREHEDWYVCEHCQSPRFDPRALKVIPAHGLEPGAAGPYEYEVVWDVQRKVGDGAA